MRLFLLLILLLSFCSKKDVDNSYFYADSTISTQKNEMISANDHFYNNTVIKTLKNSIIKSSFNDIDILIKKNSEVGFFQNDSEVFVYLYKGMIRISQNEGFQNRERVVAINTINNKTYLLNGGNIILQTYDSSQQVSTTKKGLIIDGESILLGELFYSDKKTSDIMYLSKDFLVNSVDWLDSLTYSELEALYLKPGNYPTIIPFIKTAYINTKLSMKLGFNKRNKNDDIKIISYKIPRKAKLKNGKIIWQPSKIGKYKFSFTLTDGKDTVTSYNFVRIKKSLTGKVKGYVNYIGERKSQVTLDMSNISSKITGSDGLSFKIIGNGSDGIWGNDKIVTITTSGTGFRNYKIYTKSLNKEILVNNIRVKLDLPPTLNFSLGKKEYYLNSQISLDLSKSRDDFSNALDVKATILVDGKNYKTMNFKSNKKPYLKLSKIGNWLISFVLTDKRGLQTSEKYNFKVIHTLSVNLDKSYSINVNKQFHQRFKIKGKHIKGVKIVFKNKLLNPIVTNGAFVLSEYFKKEGVYPFKIILTDKKDKKTSFSSKIEVVNMIGNVQIKVLSKDLSINRPIIFEAITKEFDNIVTKIRWDFSNNGRWDIETRDGGKSVIHTFAKQGVYTVVCEMETDDGKKVRNYYDINISNSAPIAIAPTPMAIVRATDVTLVARAKDKEKTKLFYSWDINGDGKFDLYGKKVTIKVTKFMKIKLKVMDTDSLFSTDTTRIVLCPRGMRLVKDGLYCIDRYEYPNKKGVIPNINISYAEAEKKCTQEGKRLCYPQEWEKACKGEFNQRFSYGNSFKEKACNTYGQENRVTYSGKKVNCVSFYGTYSQNGNVAEWTKSNGSKANVYGGSYFSKDKNSACDSKVELDKNKKLPYVGFRCCK